MSFGEHEKAEARLIKCALQPDSSTVQARILGDDVTYKLGAPGRHLILNSLAVLAAVKLAGADLALAALALADLAPATGRGARIDARSAGRQRHADRRELQRQSGLDARRAGACSARPRSAPRGRRIAVLGDMLELGPQGPQLHGALADAVVDNAVDLVFCSGPLMRSLWEALPSERRGGYAEASAALESRRARRGARGRRGHGQGFARLEDGAYRQGADPPIFPSRRRRGAGTRLNRCSTGWPTFPARSRSSTCSATSRCAPAAR